MTMAMGVLVCFNCCITEQPQPKRRRHIDRSMIGEPMNFRHTAHIGSGDVGLTPNSSSNSCEFRRTSQETLKAGNEHDDATNKTKENVSEIAPCSESDTTDNGSVTEGVTEGTKEDKNFLTLTNIQGQMSSKGEVYDAASPVAVHINVIDLPVRNNS